MRRRDLNLATRSCVVTGALCIRTALISSSVTGPVDDAGTAAAAGFEDDPPLVVAPFFAAETSSSFTGFTS